MDDLEVETVEELPEPSVGAAEYVLYGGKGGVGKTTMAAATGLASAREGTPTLVVSTDPAHSLSDAYGVDVPSEPAKLREDDPLYGVEIDPDEALADAEMFGADGSVEAGGLGGMLGEEGGLGDLLGGPMPGADEAAATQQLMRFMGDERFERVVVDTAPTGHTLRLLELPDVMDSMLGRMAQAKQRFGDMLGSVPGFDGEGGPDMDEIRERVERLGNLLRDPERTDFRIVMVPEEMSVVESKRLKERLDAFGVPVGTVVVNRVMEELTDVVAEAGTDAEAFVSPDLDDCAFCQRRWQVQQHALREASDLFRGHDVKRVPLFAGEVKGEKALRVVGACLA
jgi:arsenite-transporting ATPase